VDEPPVDVEIEKPHVHHKRTGHNWFDLAIPLAALFVSFVSIFIAWHHGQVMKELVHQNEKLVEANSLPYVQIYGSNRRSGYASFTAVNEGIGPAKITTAEVSVDGHAVRNLDQLLNDCCGGADDAAVSSSTLLGRMIRPGDTVPFIEISGDVEKAAAFDRGRQAKRIVTRLCYCSVFDDCWMSDSTDPTPDAVNQCPRPRVPYEQ
jgi:hypothetical protein